MSITMSCRPDESGAYPEGAWVNLEPVYESHLFESKCYGAKGDAGYYRTWNPASKAYEEVLPFFGPYRPVVIGLKPQVSPDHVMATTHRGLVLETREINGYDDSDFYAVVWVPEKETVEKITYASTRGWTYDCGASVDATPEVRAAYNAKVAYDRRRAQVLGRRSVSKQRAALAAKFDVRISAIRRLEKAYGVIRPGDIAPAPTRYSAHDRGLAVSLGFYREAQTVDRMLHLVSSFLDKRLRNPFKQKLAQQVLDWLRDPAPRFTSPLSPKQAQYV